LFTIKFLELISSIWYSLVLKRVLKDLKQ